MIIGISGAQGQGKSTLIKAAVERNSRFDAPDIQTSRNLLKDWGFTLAEVNTYMPLKIKFQDELFARHERTLHGLSARSGVFLVERTFADIFTYAVLSVGPFNEHSEWLSHYYYRCQEAQGRLFDHMIYLSGRTYKPEEDGVRSTNVHFAKLADSCIEQYTQEFAPSIKRYGAACNCSEAIAIQRNSDVNLFRSRPPRGSPDTLRGPRAPAG